MSNSPIVYVVDDDEAARKSLSFLFRSVGLAVEAYASARSFLASGDLTASGCVVTDVRMPDMNGLELLRAIRATTASLPVIVITGHGDIPLAVAAMKEGAADFFEKPFNDDLIITSVRRALDTVVVSPDDDDTATARRRVDQLSGRERQVLDGLLEGLPNKTIAYDLGISARTVEIYRANIMSKMDAGSFAELVRLAIRAGVDKAPRS